MCIGKERILIYWLIEALWGKEIIFFFINLLMLRLGLGEQYTVFIISRMSTWLTNCNYWRIPKFRVVLYFANIYEYIYHFICTYRLPDWITPWVLSIAQRLNWTSGINWLLIVDCQTEDWTAQWSHIFFFFLCCMCTGLYRCTRTCLWKFSMW